MNDDVSSQSFTSEAGVATALEEVPRRRIGLTTRILLSISVGCLSTGVLCVLYLLAFVKLRNNEAGWTWLYEVMSYLWMPAYYCASLFPLKFEKGIYLTVIFNVVIYTSIVFVGSSLLNRLRRR